MPRKQKIVTPKRSSLNFENIKPKVERNIISGFDSIKYKNVCTAKFFILRYITEAIYSKKRNMDKGKWDLSNFKYYCLDARNGVLFIAVADTLLNKAISKLNKPALIEAEGMFLQRYNNPFFRIYNVKKVNNHKVYDLHRNAAQQAKNINKKWGGWGISLFERREELLVKNLKEVKINTQKAKMTNLFKELVNKLEDFNDYDNREYKKKNKTNISFS